METSTQDPFVVLGGDRRFCQFFRFNQHIAAKVGQLVGDVYYEKAVDVPMEVGHFFTPEEAISQQQRFHQPKTAFIL